MQWKSSLLGFQLGDLSQQQVLVTSWNLNRPQCQLSLSNAEQVHDSTPEWVAHQESK